MKRADLRSVSPEDAAFWFARLHSDACTQRDRSRFDTWLGASPDNADAYAAHEALWHELHEMAADPVIMAMRHEALAARDEAPRSIAWDRIGALAASIAVFLVAGLALINTGWLRAPEPAVIAAAPGTSPKSADIFRTRKEQRSTITLADGSSVELNADSMLQVRFNGRFRDVRLLRGQALFEVAHDKSRPFRVEAGDRRIVALGTAFDVNIRTNSLNVTLIEGKVAVEPRDAREGASEVRQLNPGQQLVVRANAPATIAPVDVTKAMSWRVGRVIFSDEPLATVVEEINRYSVRQVELADPAMGDLRVSGVFRTGSVDSFTTALSLTLPVREKRATDRDAIILEWQ